MAFRERACAPVDGGHCNDSVRLGVDERGHHFIVKTGSEIVGDGVIAFVKLRDEYALFTGNDRVVL